MSSNVLKRGARGGGITTTGQLIRILLQFISLILLSRMLDPSSFGLVAMVTVFLSLGELLRDFGLANSALQAKTLSQTQQTNLFWMNTGLGALLGLIMVLCAPLLVAAYGETEVSGIAIALSVVMLLNGMQAQIQVHLARRMQFMSLTVTDLTAQFLSIGVAVLIASIGGEYWALVGQTITNALLLLLLRWLAARWMPGVPHRDGVTGPLVSDAAKLGAAQILNFSASNADTIIVGAFYGAGPLGLYNRAFQLLSAPVSKILAPLTRVSVPSIMRAQSEGHDHHSLLLRVQTMLSVPLVLVFVVASSTASALVPILLGPGWDGSVLLFQLLCIGGSFQILSYCSYWGFLLSQQSGAYLRYTLVTKPLAVILITCGAFFGVEAIALAFSIGVAVSWPLGLWWLSRCARQPFWPFLRGGARVIVAGLVGFAVGHSATLLVSAPILQLMIGGLASMLSYVTVFAATSAGRKELRLLVRGLLASVKRSR